MKYIYILLFLFALGACTSTGKPPESHEVLRKNLKSYSTIVKDPKIKAMTDEAVQVIKVCDENSIVMQELESEIKKLKKQIWNYKLQKLKNIFGDLFRLVSSFFIGALVGRFLWDIILNFIITLLRGGK